MACASVQVHVFKLQSYCGYTEASGDQTSLIARAVLSRDLEATVSAYFGYQLEKRGMPIHT